MVTLAEFQQMMKKHRTTLAGMHMAFTGPDVPVKFRNPANQQSSALSRYHRARKTIISIYR